MESILVYDTTLRDGSQGEKINFSAEDKLRVAQRLDALGIHYIEGGWPGSNPKDIHFFELAKQVPFKQARLTAFGSTRKPNTSCEQDENLKALLQSETPAVAIVGKSWDLHVKEVIGTTLKENLAMIYDSMAYLRSHDREVIYDAEHFFDGYKNNPDYAMKTIEAAVSGGAHVIVLCDTNGGTLPFEIQEIMEKICPRIPVKVGIHAHNDCGLAVANTLVAVRAGAVMVQGTVNGYGERCGNADLTSVVPNLQLKMGLSCMTDENLRRITELSRYVSEVANMTPFNGRPFVGTSAFAHKGGIHVNAIMKTPRAYEHMEPEAIGNERRVLISDLSGKSNVDYKARELGIELGGNGFDSRKIAKEIKRLEHEGYQFDAAEGSFELLLRRLTGQFKPLFELESFRVAIEKDKNLPCRAYATIKISVGDQQEITAAEGNGPVSALDNALRKALNKFFMVDLEKMHLVDFKVRVIEGREGTSARVKVFIDSRDQKRVWSTIGVSTDIIEASWQALEDSFQYKLSHI
ncbi:MAG: citramalate synthase [Deltaproteobacteria bacterium]|nr:citramalate synthase [Deltaproteobacteria bacterium]MBW2019710.1 citramalate synthase [Deltaproteobacteria bacterium]MBW2074523.1 citramalate synthase [Deltaproteobacteria bacterium]RLB81800.1 MAG: citramalate synthase [Deltaproteobacteria bacterium]